MDDNLPRRRAIGALIGAWVGLVYTIFSYSINPVVIHDLPIYFDSGKFIVSLLSYSLVGGILGFVVNISVQGLPAIIFSSLAASIAIFIGSFINAAGNGEALAFVMLIMFYSFMPLVVMVMPLTALLRWTAGRLQHVHGPAWRKWRNWGLLLGLTLLGGLFGSLSLHAGESRQMLYRMDDLIKRVHESGAEKVPVEFLPVVGVIQNASPEYKLGWTDNLKEFPAPIYFEDSYASSRMQIVFAYFDSGHVVACLFRVIDSGIYLCTATP
jgi:hypothetical protein